MNFQIEWAEQKESKTGVPYYKLSLTDSDGKTYQDVAVFGKHPEFKDIQPGRSISGELKEDNFRGKTSYVLNSERKLEPPQFIKQSSIQKAQDRKQETITKSQDRKEESISLAQTFRDATLIVTTLFPELSELQENYNKEDAIKMEWEKWQRFFEGKWNNKKVGF